jgi:hypothetical protein
MPSAPARLGRTIFSVWVFRTRRGNSSCAWAVASAPCPAPFCHSERSEESLHAPVRARERFFASLRVTSVRGMAFAAKLFRVRHQIHPAARKGMAPQHAAQRQPRPTPRSVDSHGIRRVMRARGIKLAGARHQRRKKSLVHAHQKEQRARLPAHTCAFGALLRIPRSRRTSSASSGANSARATELRG